MKIAVAGTGYVGLSIATLLSQHHQVTAVDVIPEKVEMLNQRKSPIQDEYIEKYLAEKQLNITATLDGASAYRDADFVVIAAPTNYDPTKNKVKEYFSTHTPRYFRKIETCRLKELPNAEGKSFVDKLLLLYLQKTTIVYNRKHGVIYRIVNKTDAILKRMIKP